MRHPTPEVGPTLRPANRRCEEAYITHQNQPSQMRHSIGPRAVAAFSTGNADLSHGLSRSTSFWALVALTNTVDKKSRPQCGKFVWENWREIPRPEFCKFRQLTTWRSLGDSNPCFRRESQCCRQPRTPANKRISIFYGPFH